MKETNFSQPAIRISGLCGAALVFLTTGILAAVPEFPKHPQESARPAISGKVSDRDGKPLSGVSVIIWTAGPKKGYSTYCPGCYADCGKRAKTDTQGEFSIGRVDPTLRFNLLIVGEGFAPLDVRKVEPFGKPVAATLERRASPADPSQVVRGQIAGPTGSPLADAVIEPEMVWYIEKDGRLGGRGGAVEGLDPLAVSNEKGEFEIAYARPAVKMTICVTARGMAPKWFADLPTGSERHTLEVARGATIRGRLVSFGKPVPKAEMGLINRERGMGEHFSEQRIGTQPDGTFLFANVPAPNAWFVYAKMDSILRLGATIPVSCRTARDGEIIDVGDISVKAGHRVRGRVVLTDGKPIADGMRMNVSSQEAWDNQSIPLPADGRFEFVNVPTGEYSLFPSVKGYHLSDKNPNLSWTIEGHVNHDLDNFIILLDPGRETYQGRYAGRFRGKPLVSARQP
jgi:hypothetical protein